MLLYTKGEILIIYELELVHILNWSSQSIMLKYKGKKLTEFTRFTGKDKLILINNKFTNWFGPNVKKTSFHCNSRKLFRRIRVSGSRISILTQLVELWAWLLELANQREAHRQDSRLTYKTKSNSSGI